MTIENGQEDTVQYLLLDRGLFGLMAFHYLFAVATQVVQIPYREFQTYLTQERIAEVAVTGQIENTFLCDILLLVVPAALFVALKMRRRWTTRITARHREVSGAVGRFLFFL